MGTADYAVEIRNVTKRFPGVIASNGVNFAVRRGEIHALLGENGAGKSTLMNMLTGLIRPDSGDILIDGKKVALRSPADAISLGIGMVHQHFRLVETFTVAENITLGMPTPRFRLDMDPIEQEVQEFSAKFGLEVTSPHLAAFRRRAAAGGDHQDALGVTSSSSMSPPPSHPMGEKSCSR